LSSGERADGVTFHDLRSGARAAYYDGYRAYSPRFSPDGARWAFFGKSDLDHLALIIRWTREPRERVVPLSRELAHGGQVLAWSPTGARIARSLFEPACHLGFAGATAPHRVAVQGKLLFRYKQDETGVYILLPDIEAIPYATDP
jgi:hypothetical protein